MSMEYFHYAHTSQHHKHHNQECLMDVFVKVECRQFSISNKSERERDTQSENGTQKQAATLALLE